ncbi:hypothetical protein ACFCV8_06845 [Streptomyces sp. NPDC056347]|uniref:hypothetical protein n=1 Tax=Streptomyces sp. NPDC056347 TaxID=3345790 RepID=UPI0035D85313
MLNPIDTDKVIRDGGVTGRFPGEIHEGVAWWVAACLVVITRAQHLAVAHDGHPTSVAFHDRLCRGAVNADHHACHVADLGEATKGVLMAAMQDLGAVPGIRVSTLPAHDGQTVRISLYDQEGRPLGEDEGLGRIRDLIASDRVPIPVNTAAKGTVAPYPCGEGQA